ncbi:hypothetical protein OG746_37095 [Streptomyces sp. NBC_01016]|uniref:hypothetical protein n=1 Tax=Streptomyces sp. NBC_01016 TaxID=2903720 RepID=UPI002257082C|nr:hypothetical protein [Streptomyces sp. NBC_01016]MCX4834345.1 hypothetical protein [Streptomyces sp. NBC_01016]
MPRRQGDGSCAHCLAWANDRLTLCHGCCGWRQLHPEVSDCERCGRRLPLSSRKCRFCTLLLRETAADVSGIALTGGDQLWFGGEFALRMSDRYLSAGGSSRGRFQVKERRMRATVRDERPVSPHLVDPAQLELFPAPPRTWARLNPEDEYALTTEAKALRDDFADYLRRNGVDPRFAGGGSLRTLRTLTGRLGVAAPLREADVKAIATLSENHNGRRVICFLRLHGLLEPEPIRKAELIRARTLASSLSAPFAAAVHLWIDVLLGQGHQPSPALAPVTIYGDVWNVVPTLKLWAISGITDLKEVTTDDITAALTDMPPARRRAAHVPLRSLFRALRRERRIFRDPARGVSLPQAVKLPTPLPSDTLKGLLGKAGDARSKFIVALVAVHALTHADMLPLLLEDLDRVRGRLRVRRPGRRDHIVYLDEITTELATAWLRERHRRWPQTTSPYLLVSRVSAADEAGPMMTKEVTKEVFARVGITAGKLREDRIYDEARYTDDPVHLMRTFGLATSTAMKYITAAHPDKHPDPIQA